MASLDAPTRLEVLYEDAPPHIKKIYDEITASFRVPVVNLVFRSLALHPDYLELAWQQLRPNVQTVFLERRADEIRSYAVRSMANLGAPPKPGPEATAVLRVFNYVNPKLLIALAALRTGTVGPLPRVRILPTDEKRQVASGVPSTMPFISMVELDSTNSIVMSVFDDIRSTLGVDIVNSDYRALAQWPDYLSWAWQSVKGVTNHPEYLRVQTTLRLMAEESVLSLPFRIDCSPHTLRLCGMSEAAIDDVHDTLARFYRLLPALVANIAFLSVGAEGEYGALTSHFPVTLQ